MIFGRRKSSDPQPPDEMLGGDDADTQGPPGRPRGPWDRTETTADTDGEGYLDLGGLIVRGSPDVEVRLQVDEPTSAVLAVLLAGRESGLELRAFAAPRSNGIWDDVRRAIAAEAVQRGGTSSELDGEYGTELQVVVPVQMPDGRTGSQVSRIVGVEGPRWLLRGTFLGKSAENPDPDGAIESAFRDVIVVRGDGPMSPRELISLRMPQQAQVMLPPEPEAEPGN